MSTTPPPGWYPDPTAPHLWRWWDGTAWTEHRGAPGEPSGPPAAPPPPGRGRSRARALALVAAGTVLAAAVVTGVVVLGRGDGSGGEARTAPTAPSAPSTSTVPSTDPPSPAASASDDPSVVVDQLNGITLPVLDGWEKPRYAQDDVVLTTQGTYDCPAGMGLCRHGLVITRTPTTAEGTTPEALARRDIEEAAEQAYDENAAGQRLYGGIVSHRTVAFGPIAVAGRAGYFVRWRVDTAKGPGGYVESVAFHSSTGTEAPVIVRLVFDAGPDGPPLADMHRIVKGIRPLGDAGTGGGVGSSIGPSG